MKCPKCGAEVEGKFCKECGTQMTFSDAFQQPVQQVPLAPPIAPTPQMQPKKKKLKGWQVALIVVGCVVVISAIATSGEKESTSVNASNSQTASAQVESKKEVEPSSASVQASSDTPSVSPETEKANYIAQCNKFDFKAIARNPDKYKGEYYAITGEVIQVTEGFFNQVDLRVNVTKDEYGYWDDTIYVTITIPDGEDKILENDVVTLYGQCDGNYTYTSVLGASVSLPKINAEYYELK